MYEKWLMLKNKVVENKDILIKAGSAVAGALVGLAVVSFVANSYDELSIEEEMGLALDEELSE